MWHKTMYTISGTYGTRHVRIGPFASMVKAALFLARFGLVLQAWEVHAGELDAIGVMQNVTLRVAKKVNRLRARLHLTGLETTLECWDMKFDPLLPRARKLLSH